MFFNNIENPHIEPMKKFIEEFDEFSLKFYRYVDKIAD